ncbi:hypothetical protein F511_39240 [Dorcoceras hygrometricum]|uniref:Uncharacterized protein n=1 Tax=Dorcoceras hygrometricum TaxID=472368 RepID=A0A2Z7D1B9_9LAMI|nr:hypothetical protein F511_39240 [Dorcoceras hygrometricum]
MPPRRGRGSTARRTAEGSRASESDEDVQLHRRERQAEVEDVTRQIRNNNNSNRIQIPNTQKRGTSAGSVHIINITGTHGKWDRPVEPPICPAWLPEDPANGGSGGVSCGQCGGDRPAEPPLCPAWIPEDPTKMGNADPRHKSRKTNTRHNVAPNQVIKSICQRLNMSKTHKINHSMFTAKAAKGCSIRTSISTNSTSLISQKGTADSRPATSFLLALLMRGRRTQHKFYLATQRLQATGIDDGKLRIKSRVSTEKIRNDGLRNILSVGPEKQDQKDQQPRIFKS